ncbi:hypothetical protein [Arthrobacter globiformis]|nr:hypothetical protein [Arthrobacter globiformis]
MAASSGSSEKVSLCQVPSAYKSQDSNSLKSLAAQISFTEWKL